MCAWCQDFQAAWGVASLEEWGVVSQGVDFQVVAVQAVRCTFSTAASMPVAEVSLFVKGL